MSVTARYKKQKDPGHRLNGSEKRKWIVTPYCTGIWSLGLVPEPSIMTGDSHAKCD